MTTIATPLETKIRKTRKQNTLRDVELQGLKSEAKPYKVVDGNGMYVVVSPAGGKTFRYDYRLNGRRETLTIGRYDKNMANRKTDELDVLDFGMAVSLADARTLLDRARRMVDEGRSPSRAKVEQRVESTDASTFGAWAHRYFKFKADPKSGDECLAESTLAMRKSNYTRLLEKPLGRKNLDEIKATALSDLFDEIKEKRGPGPAVHAREIVLAIFRFAQDKGVEINNPAERIRASKIATFKARDRTLTRNEIKVFFDALQETPTTPTLRLALKFVLLTMVRKGEFIGGVWSELDWERAAWTIPAARMKADNAHTVYLSDQVLDILTTFKTCFGSSKYFHPSRYDSNLPISDATLNRVIDATVKLINKNLPEGAEEFQPFCVHDLRRTASTRLNEALFNEALIEVCLAHVKKDQVAAAYNHAKHAGPRRVLMQAWADMVDCWMRGESAKNVIQDAKIKIAEAAHDQVEADL